MTVCMYVCMCLWDVRGFFLDFPTRTLDLGIFDYGPRLWGLDRGPGAER